jgi:hypothetical protein
MQRRLIVSMVCLQCERSYGRAEDEEAIHSRVNVGRVIVLSNPLAVAGSGRRSRSHAPGAGDIGGVSGGGLRHGVAAQVDFTSKV